MSTTIYKEISVKSLVRIAGAAAVAVAVFASAGASAQTQPKAEFQPQVGQAGKDVIWVPTPDALVERMLTMAQATPNDFVVDLGAGDGRIAIAAARKFGAKSMGIEFNPDMVALSKKNAAKDGVGEKVEFVRGDIFETDFSKATVVTMYLLPTLNAKLRPKILDMKPGTRVASHQFDMEDWEPDELDTFEGRRAYLWIVPAKVQGGWKLRFPAGAETRELNLTLEQRYQALKGNVKFGEINAGLREPALRGDTIHFAFVDTAGVRREFAGKVSGNTMEGTVRTDGGGESRWTATR
jgi:SAM-dependent methyltransferase